MKNIKGKRKNRLFIRTAFLVMVAAFFFLMTSQDFLHQHSLDNGEREDCPIFMFKQAVHFSHLLWFGIVFFILALCGRCGLSPEQPKGQAPLTAISGRAPPVSF